MEWTYCPNCIQALRNRVGQAEAELAIAVSAARVQNRACAEEMAAREHMQAGWDTMVTSVKRHYEAQMDAEAASRELRLNNAILLTSLHAADLRLSEVSNYLGPFDHASMFHSLTDTIHEVRRAIAQAKSDT